MTPTDLPYCLIRKNNGEYIEVKHLGRDSDEPRDFEKLSGFPLDMKEGDASSLSHCRDDDRSRIFLYCECSPPWLNEEATSAYLDRLKFLRYLKRKTERDQWDLATRDSNW